MVRKTEISSNPDISIKKNDEESIIKNYERMIKKNIASLMYPLLNYQSAYPFHAHLVLMMLFSLGLAPVPF